MRDRSLDLKVQSNSAPNHSLSVRPPDQVLLGVLAPPGFWVWGLNGGLAIRLAIFVGGFCGAEEA